MNFWLTFLALCTVAFADPDGFLLADVKTMTFQKDQLAIRHRYPSVSQLVCEGDLCDSVLLPNMVQCTNQGLDEYGHVQWECKTNSLDDHVGFKKTNVVCEGVTPGNPIVHKGSCSLHYVLERLSFPSAAYTIHDVDDGRALACVILFSVMVLCFLWLCTHCTMTETVYTVPAPSVHYTVPPPAPSVHHTYASAPPVTVHHYSTPVPVRYSSDFSTGVLVGSALSRPSCVPVAPPPPRVPSPRHTTVRHRSGATKTGFASTTIL